VHRSVMDSAGIEPDREIQESSPPIENEAPPPPTAEDSSRLSVFKDFIDKLDLDKPDKDKPASN